MTTVKEARKTIEELERLKDNCEKIRLFAINSKREEIASLEEDMCLSTPLHMMCDALQDVLEHEALRIEKAVESAEVDVRLPIFA